MDILNCGEPYNTKSQPTIVETLKWLEENQNPWVLFLDTEGSHERIKKSIEELMKKDKAYVAPMDA